MGRMAQVDDKTWARDRDLIAKLMSEGQGRNRISKETGLTKYRIDKICRAEGWKFDGSAVTPMVKQFQATAAVERAKISQQILEEIQHVIKRMHEEHVVIGWHQGMAFEHKIAAPTAGDYKAYATVLGILIDKHLVLERFGTEAESQDRTLAQVQMATEVARLIRAHPDLSIDDIVNEIVNRHEDTDA
uniref:Helix-turn-helix protein n=1 Tax=Micrococcus phage Olihed TaxID=3092209 RepID=A0AAU6R612_9CAUD